MQGSSFGNGTFPFLSLLYKALHLATREEFIFLISTWLRINVPFLNFPTCPTRPLDKILGADFFFLDFLHLKWEKGTRVKMVRIAVPPARPPRSAPANPAPPRHSPCPDCSTTGLPMLPEACRMPSCLYWFLSHRMSCYRIFSGCPLLFTQFSSQISPP